MSLENTVNNLTDEQKLEMIKFLRASIDVDAPKKKKKKRRKSKKQQEQKSIVVNTLDDEVSQEEIPQDNLSKFERPKKVAGQIPKNQPMFIADQTQMTGNQTEEAAMQARNGIDEYIHNQMQSGNLFITPRIPRANMTNARCIKCGMDEEVYSSNAGFRIVDGRTVYYCNRCSMTGR